MSDKERASQLDGIGARIRRYREEAGLTLSGLANRAHVSKGYLSRLESETTEARPSGQTLYSLAEALGVTMSDLLGRKLLPAAKEGETPEPLRQFADEADIPEADVRMLASIEFRGDPPQTKERWQHIYTAIRTSAALDTNLRNRKGDSSR